MSGKEFASNPGYLYKLPQSMNSTTCAKKCCLHDTCHVAYYRNKVCYGFCHVAYYRNKACYGHFLSGYPLHFSRHFVFLQKIFSPLKIFSIGDHLVEKYDPTPTIFTINLTPPPFNKDPLRPFSF